MAEPSTPPRLSAPQGLDDLLLYRLSQVLALAGAPVIRLCEGQHGITRREWRVIATLARHGAMRSSALAKHALLDRARTSKASSSLVAKGLLQRSPGAGDARAVHLALSPAGLALYQTLWPQVCAINARLLQALPAPAVATLDAALAQLLAQAQALGVDSTLPRTGRHLGKGRRPQA